MKTPNSGIFDTNLAKGCLHRKMDPVAKSAVPVIHVTDLYCPAQDPDDHWDLASQYALASQGLIDLKGIVIDYVPDRTLAGKGHQGGDPDVRAVAQMNAITGMAVPVVVGTRGKIRSIDLSEEVASRPDLGAVRFIHQVLEESDEPVVIHIAGTARDVALAGHSAPELFAAKCRGIYYNAGYSVSEGKDVEYNTDLDKIGYAAIFRLPCPVFWMPCFSVGGDWHRQPERREELYGNRFDHMLPYETYWRFEHADILPGLPVSLQRFFLYMYRNFEDFRLQPENLNYLRYLRKETETDLLHVVNPTLRNMWCTAGFLHSAGLCVDRAGRIRPMDAKDVDSWYCFEPARIQPEDSGITRWSLDPDSRDRFIFRNLGWDAYNQSMKDGLRELLSTLP